MVTPRNGAGAAFSGDASPFAIPVKNTFINFDVPLATVGATRARAKSCPPSPSHAQGGVGHDDAIQELCHAMVPGKAMAGRQDAVARGVRRPQKEHAAKTGAGVMPAGAEVDCISEVSTGVSEGGSPDTPASNVQEPVTLTSQWTSISRRDKTKARVANQPLTQVPHDEHAATANSGSRHAQAPAPTTPTVNKPSGRKDAPYSRKYDGKGKGLSNFQRIEVGIEDDREFRVVQRLIGPKGRHMQDIVTEAKGAKVWIIGRGSRSWEDDEGPLMVCVGAMSSSVFDVAVGLVRELLAKTRKEYSKFHRGQ